MDFKENYLQEVQMSVSQEANSSKSKRQILDMKVTKFCMPLNIGSVRIFKTLKVYMKKENRGNICSSGSKMVVKFKRLSANAAEKFQAFYHQEHHLPV